MVFCGCIFIVIRLCCWFSCWFWLFAILCCLVILVVVLRFRLSCLCLVWVYGTCFVVLWFAACCVGAYLLVDAGGFILLVVWLLLTMVGSLAVRLLCLIRFGAYWFVFLTLSVGLDGWFAVWVCVGDFMGGGCWVFWLMLNGLVACGSSG